MHPPLTYWQSLQSGGPIFQALHLLLVATFIGSLVMDRYRAPIHFSLTLAAFIVGVYYCAAPRQEAILPMTATPNEAMRGTGYPVWLTFLF